MRKTPLPLLRDLPKGVTVNRCNICCELVLGAEQCRDADEAQRCPPRLLIEKPPQPVRDERYLYRPHRGEQEDWMLP